MLHLTLLATTGIPNTVTWSPTVGIIMVICNVLAIALGKATMAQPSAGPALPSPEMFGGMGVPALLATTSFGHVIGFVVIFTLAAKGVL